ncbi:MAG: hypothetical protein J5750_07290 [Clostridiales bacterium]|nr:hypothetical protein [Clostridiales bacterium]
MMEFILDYLAGKGVSAGSKEEQEKLDEGIRLFLLENGLRETDIDAYHKRYVVSVLSKISDTDLKVYLMKYPVISAVMQIVLEWKADGRVPSLRKEDLRSLMKELYESGLGEKYIPAAEVQMILQ